MKYSKKSRGIKVKAGIRAGGFGENHSAKVVATPKKPVAGIKVRSGIRAGGFGENHNAKLV